MSAKAFGGVGRRSPAAGRSVSPATAAARRRRQASPPSRESSLATSIASDVLLDGNQALTDDDDASLLALSAAAPPAPPPQQQRLHQRPPESPVGGDESLLDSCFLKATPDSWNPGAGQRGRDAVDDRQSGLAQSPRESAGSSVRRMSAGSGSMLPVLRSHSPVGGGSRGRSGGGGSADGGGNGLHRSASASSLSSRLPRWVGSSAAGEQRSDDEGDRSEERSLTVTTAQPDDSLAATSSLQHSRSLVQFVGPASVLSRIGTAFRSPRKQGVAAAAQSGSSRRVPLRALSPAATSLHGKRSVPVSAGGGSGSRRPGGMVGGVAPVAAVDTQAGAWGTQRSTTPAASSGRDDGDDDDSLRAPDVTSLVHDLYDNEGADADAAAATATAAAFAFDEPLSGATTAAAAAAAAAAQPWLSGVLSSFEHDVEASLQPGNAAAAQWWSAGLSAGGQSSGAAGHLIAAAAADDDDDALPKSLLELLGASSPRQQQRAATQQAARDHVLPKPGDGDDEFTQPATSALYSLTLPAATPRSSRGGDASAASVTLSRQQRGVETTSVASGGRSAASKLPILVRGGGGGGGGSRSSSPLRNRSRPATPGSLSPTRPQTPTRIPVPSARRSTPLPIGLRDNVTTEAAAEGMTSARLSQSAVGSAGRDAALASGHHVENTTERGAAQLREAVIAETPMTAPHDEIQSNLHIEDRAADPTAGPHRARSGQRAPAAAAAAAAADDDPQSHDWRYYETPSNAYAHGNSDTDRQVSWPSSARNTNRTERSHVVFPEEPHQPKSKGVSTNDAAAVVSASASRKSGVVVSAKATDRRKNGSAVGGANASITESNPSPSHLKNSPHQHAGGLSAGKSNSGQQRPPVSSGPRGLRAASTKSDTATAASAAAAATPPPARPAMKGRFSERGYTSPMLVDRDDGKGRQSAASSVGNLTVGGSSVASSRTTRSADDREVLSQLQMDYEELLTKYALAEVTIDQLRLGAKFILEPVQPNGTGTQVNTTGVSGRAATGAEAAAASAQAPRLVPGRMQGTQVSPSEPFVRDSSDHGRSIGNNSFVDEGQNHVMLMQRAAELEKELEQLKASLATVGLKPGDLRVLLGDYEQLLARFERLRVDCSDAASAEATLSASGLGSAGGGGLMDGRLVELEAKLELVRSLLLLNGDRALGRDAADAGSSQQQHQPRQTVHPATTARAPLTVSSLGAAPTTATASGSASVLLNGDGVVKESSDFIVGGNADEHLGKDRAGFAAHSAVAASVAVASDNDSHSPGKLQSTGSGGQIATAAATGAAAAGAAAAAAERRSDSSSDDEMLERKQQQLQLLRRYRSLKKLPRTAERAKEIRQLAEQLQGCLRSTDSSEASLLSGSFGPEALNPATGSSAARQLPAARRHTSGGGGVAMTGAGQQSSHDSGLSTPRLQPPHYVSTLRLKLGRMQDSDSGFVPSEGGLLSPESSTRLARGGGIISSSSVYAAAETHEQPHLHSRAAAEATFLPSSTAAAAVTLSPVISAADPLAPLLTAVPASPSEQWSPGSPGSKLLLEDEVMPTVDDYGSPESSASPPRGNGTNIGIGHSFEPPHYDLWGTAASANDGSAATQKLGVGLLPQASVSSSILGRSFSTSASTAAAADDSKRASLRSVLSSGVHISDEPTVRKTPAATASTVVDLSPSAILSASEIGGSSSNSGSTRDSKKSRRSAGFRALMKEVAQLRDDLRSSVLAASCSDGVSEPVPLPATGATSGPVDTGSSDIAGSRMTSGRAGAAAAAADQLPAARRAAQGELTRNPQSDGRVELAEALPASLGRRRVGEAVDGVQSQRYGRGERGHSASIATAAESRGFTGGPAAGTEVPPRPWHDRRSFVPTASAGEDAAAGVARTSGLADSKASSSARRGRPLDDESIEPLQGAARSDPGRTSGRARRRSRGPATDAPAEDVALASVAADKEHEIVQRERPRHGTRRHTAIPAGDRHRRLPASSRSRRRTGSGRRQRRGHRSADSDSDGAAVNRRLAFSSGESADEEEERPLHSSKRWRRGGGHGSSPQLPASLASCPACLGTGAATITSPAGISPARTYVRLTPSSPAAAVGVPAADVTLPALTGSQPPTVVPAAWVLCPSTAAARSSAAGTRSVSAVAAIQSSSDAGGRADGQAMIRPALFRGDGSHVTFGALVPVSMAPVCSGCGALLTATRDQLASAAVETSRRVNTPVDGLEHEMAASATDVIQQQQQQLQQQLDAPKSATGYLSTIVATRSGPGYVTMPVTLEVAAPHSNGLSVLAAGEPKLLSLPNTAYRQKERKASRASHKKHFTTAGYHGDVMAALSSARSSATKLRQLSSRMREQLEGEVSGCMVSSARPATR